MKCGRLLLTLSFSALLVVPTLSSGSSANENASPASLPMGETDGRAGSCYSFYPDPVTGEGRPFMPLAYSAGSRWDRFDFVWPNLERQDGSWKGEGLQAYDTLVNDLHTAGFNMVGILLWTPDWAATSGVRGLSAPESGQRPPGWYAPASRSDVSSAISFPSAASSPPQGLYQPWDDPSNYWGRFVGKVVDRYGDRIKHWEMWNEPEWTYFWTGTSSDYAQLLKVGYQATKAACSDCQVLFGGLHYWANPDYYKWVLNTIRSDPAAEANSYFFDIMSVHLYSRSSNAYEVVNDIRSGMTARVPDHPIWLTETGVPMWDDATVDPVPEEYPYAATQVEAAAYVIQSYANAWASGVERYFFFRTHDADMIEYFGLIRNDKSLRPAYSAYRVATTHLISPTMTTRVAYSDGVRLVTLWGTPRGKVSVLWNLSPVARTLGYTATLPTASLVDRSGNVQTISAIGDEYQVDLPGATANLLGDPHDYFIGGDPYLIIEEDTVPPTTATVHPLPETTYSDTIRVSWDATDSEAGVWGFEVQMRPEGSTWVEWLGLSETAGKLSALYMDGEDGETYCFRARAWDRAGNVGAWSDVESCTLLRLAQQVRVSVGSVFGDEDGSGAQEAGEPILVDVLFRFMDASGADVISPTIGASWAFTITLEPGDYALTMTPHGWPSSPPGWLPWQLSVPVGTGGSGPLDVDFPAVGLSPHRSSNYFPLLPRNW